MLGPFLFIIYINDFSKCLKYSNNLSFADDATIILSAKNNNLLFQKGNKELENIDNWVIANKLSLNVKKTKYILFSFRTTKALSKESVLTIRKNQIERVTSVRLLDVIFNERLTWKDHMAMLISKLKSSLYAVIRVKPFLTQEALLTLFHSLILSHIRYCITTWCYGHSVLFNKLQKICNKFINMIICTNAAKKRNKEITKDNILNMQQLYKLNISICMYKSFHKQLPSAFKNIF